jgi:hypothetical protein
VGANLANLLAECLQLLHQGIESHGRVHCTLLKDRLFN